jgi:hypothetical protein
MSFASASRISASLPGKTTTEAPLKTFSHGWHGLA